MTDEQGPTSAIIADTGKDDGKFVEIIIPADYIEKIDSKYVLLLYENKNRAMKILPVDKDDVHLLRIEMSDMGTTFLSDLNLAFRKSGLNDMIFTTGVCMQYEKCYYECYFHESTLQVSLDELNKVLKVLKNVEKVLLKKVGTSSDDEELIDISEMTSQEDEADEEKSSGQWWSRK